MQNLGLEELGVKLTKAGAIDVDAYSRSSVSGVGAVPYPPFSPPAAPLLPFALHMSQG